MQRRHSMAGFQLRWNGGNKKGAERPVVRVAQRICFRFGKFALTCRTLGLRLRAATRCLHRSIFAREAWQFNHPSSPQEPFALNVAREASDVETS
jgi:hypothetical protein